MHFCTFFFIISFHSFTLYSLSRFAAIQKERDDDDDDDDGSSSSTNDDDDDARGGNERNRR